MSAATFVTNRWALSERRRSAALLTLVLAAAFWTWVLLAILSSANVQPATGVAPSLVDQLELARLYHADTQQALHEAQAELATACERFEAAAARQSSLADRSLAMEAGAGKMIANPARIGVESAVAAVQAERLRLLERLTVEHPNVVELDARIESLQGQLAATPELIRAPAEVQSRDQAQIALEQSELVSAYAAADHTLRMARLAHDNAAIAEQTAARQEAEISSSVSRAEVDLASRTPVTSGAEQDKLPGRVWQFGCLLGLAIIGGGSTMAWAGGALQAVFASSEQIALALGIPVLGVIETGKPVVPWRRRVAHITLNLAVCFSLVSIALAAYLMITIMNSNSAGLDALVSHPINALAGALVQLGS